MLILNFHWQTSKFTFFVMWKNFLEKSFIILYVFACVIRWFYNLLSNDCLKTSFHRFHVDILNLIALKAPLRNTELLFLVSVLQKIAITFRIY